MRVPLKMFRIFEMETFLLKKLTSRERELDDVGGEPAGSQRRQLGIVSSHVRLARSSMTDQTNLSVEVQLNAGDMYRYSMTTMFRRFRWIMVLFTVLTMYLAFQFSREGFHWSWGWGNVFAPLFFFIFFPYAFFIAPYFSSKKYLQRNPSLVGPNKYTFSSDGIDVSSPQSNGHLNWGAILEARETSSQFLLYPQTAAAHVIPKRALSVPGQLSTLRDLLRTHVKNVRLQRN